MEAKVTIQTETGISTQTLNLTCDNNQTSITKMVANIVETTTSGNWVNLDWSTGDKAGWISKSTDGIQSGKL